jgi:transcriptional regulator with XRE-family HTH domain
MYPSDSRALATFLRTRRGLVTPADVDLDDGPWRRVAGLRREEVAERAGISTEYYVRLEQGRERRPSDQVIEALARALGLGVDAVEYIRNLAHPRPCPDRDRRTERADPSMQTLLDNLEATPAYIQAPDMTILAANPLASALFPCFTAQVNILWTAFMESKFRSWLSNWDAMTGMLVAWLRFLVAQNSCDRSVRLIGELSVRNERFRMLWNRHEVTQKTSGPTAFDHPDVGRLDMRYRTFVTPESGQILVAYQAEPGSPSEDRLRRLRRPPTT